MNRFEKFSVSLVRFLIWPLIQLIVSLGSACAVALHLLFAAAAEQSRFAYCNEGISPTSMQSGNMPQAELTVMYNRNFMENLKKKLVMMRLTTRETMPVKSGQVYRNFMWPTFGPNTTYQTEGTIGTGIEITANFRDYQLGQLADYLNISDKAMVTSISNDLLSLRREMAYRLGLSLDKLVMANFDYLRVLDPNTKVLDATAAAPNFTKQMIEQAPFSLLGQDVPAMEGGSFCGAIHPFFVGDMIALDNTNNSIVDILKHTPEGQLKLEELPNGSEGDEVKVIELLGCKWMMTTDVTPTANWLNTGKTALRTYLAGKDANISIKLDRPDRTNVGDGQYQNMTLWAGEYKLGNVADPAGVVGGGTSYNCIVAFGPPPDEVSRARCWDAVPQTT